MSGSLTRFGIGAELTYGTAVAVTKSYEIISEDIRGSYPRIQAEALSAGYVDRSDRFAINNKGASGTVALEPLTAGFGSWLAYMLGSVSTSVPAETTVYTHTGIVGSLNGKAVTVQVLRSTIDDQLQPWTYEGGKVTNFEFSNAVDQTLRCNIGLDFEKESNPDAPTGVYTKTALEALSTPAGAQLLNWQSGYISIGGTEIEVSEISVRVDNALNVDRYYINQAEIKKEPLQDGKRMIEWSFRTPYVNNNFWEKVSSATVAGTYASLVARWEGLALIGTTIYPSLEISVPVARFDEGGPVVEGPSLLEQTFTGKGLWTGTGSPLTITYVSNDATVLGAA